MKNRFYTFLIIFMSIALSDSLAQDLRSLNLKWGKLAAIPDQVGFAGSFAGVADDNLIVAGGANFPDGKAPWTGGVKAWSDQVFVLDKIDGAWKTAGKLPQKLGYGASVNWKNSLIILGGSNESGHHAKVYQLNYLNGGLLIGNLPDLPHPIANTTAVLLDDVIYVIGGISTPDAKVAANNFWALDLRAAKREWKILPSWPGDPRMLSVAGVQASAVFVFSGVALVDGNRKYLKDAYRYSVREGWQKIADLPSSVAAAPSPAYPFGEHELIIFGGDDGVLAARAAELRDKHPGFSNQLLSYDVVKDNWTNSGEIRVHKKDDAITNPNGSTWAPVTTTLTVWNGNIILPGGEVRPATRTPNVLMAMPVNKK